MYLDDGVSRSSAIVSPADPMGKAEYREVCVAHRRINDSTREITVERVHDGYTPKYEKYYYVAVLHAPEDIDGPVIPIIKVTLDGKDVQYLYDYTPEKAAELLQNSETSAWYYHYGLHITFIKVIDDSPKRRIELQYK